MASYWGSMALEYYLQRALMAWKVFFLVYFWCRAALNTNLLLSRSPSPEPIYNNEGKRLNTREYRTRKKLEDERHQLVQEAWRHNPNYKPPADYKWGTLLSRHGGHNKSIRLGIAKQMYLCRRKQIQWDCIHIHDVAGWVCVNRRKMLLHRSVSILAIITWNQCNVTVSVPFAVLCFDCGKNCDLVGWEIRQDISNVHENDLCWALLWKWYLVREDNVSVI